MNNTNKELSILYWNANSITDKIEEVKILLGKYKIDIIIIAEAKLGKRNPPKIPYYHVINKKRQDNPSAGGLLLYYRKNLKATEIEINTKIIETIGIKINSVIIVGIYNSPTNVINKNEINTIMNYSNKVIAVGDFNAKNTIWNCYDNNTNGKLLFDYSIKGNFIIQAPFSFTHYPDNIQHRPSVIDIVINKNVNASIPETLNELCSDHLPIMFNTNLGPIEIINEQEKFIYKNANWKEFRKYINNCIKIDGVVSQNKIEEEIMTLTTTIQKAMDLYIPKATNKKKIEKIPDEIIDDIKERNRLRRILQRTPTIQHKNEFMELNTLIKQKLKSYREQMWNNYVKKTNFRDNSLWKLAKILKNRNNHSIIPPLHSKNGIVFEDSEKAESLADTYEEIHRQTENLSNNKTEKMVKNTIRNMLSQTISTPIEELTTPKEIFNTIKYTTSKKAPGEDSIQNIILKNLPKKAIIKLCHIYNACLTSQIFPNSWKNAVILPFKKMGKDHKFPQNYRPISLLSTLGKIYEKLILTRIKNFEFEHPTIIPNQFGFRSQRNTVLQAARIFNDILIDFNMKKSTTLVALDLEKAFDTVWHDGLIFKLIKTDMPFYIIKIIRDFLKNRTYQVKVNQTLSSKRKPAAGVPQGAILSPYLFNYFINDVPTTHETKLALFADDTAIIASTTKLNLNVRKIQKHLNVLEKFYNRWKIKANPEKTQVLHCTNRIFTNVQKLSFYNTPIEENKVMKYLGIHLDKKLLFGQHIKEVIKKTNAVFGLLYPLLKYTCPLDIKTKITLYKTVLFPIFMYASPVWSRISKCHINKLQILQNKILRVILNKKRRFPVADLHQEAEIPLIKDVLYERAQKFYGKQVKKIEETNHLGTLNPDNVPFRIKHKLLHNILL